MPTILLTEEVHADALARFDATPGFEVLRGSQFDQETFDVALTRADAIGVRIRRIDADLIARAPRLRLIAKHGVGTDNIDLAACTARGILVLNTPDANRIAVAEHAMALMLALIKRLAMHDAALRTGDWRVRDTLMAAELSGRTLAILGFGRSGQELARRARAFDMRVIAWGRTVDADVARALGVDAAGDLVTALREADVVSLHMPRPPDGKVPIGAGQIAAMKPGALLINCARGGLVDAAALAAALRSGHLSGAGIDVFDEEPPPPSDPLLAGDLGNVILTPHMAGNTREAARRMGLEMADNIIDGLAGTPDRRRIVMPPTR